MDDRPDKVYITVELPRREAVLFNTLLSNGDLTRFGIENIQLISYLDSLTASKISIARDTRRYEEERYASNVELGARVEKIKRLLAKKVEDAIQELEEALDPRSEPYNDFVLLAERYHRIFRDYHNNLLDFQTADREITKIGRTILFIVNNLTEEDLQN